MKVAENPICVYRLGALLRFARKMDGPWDEPCGQHEVCHLPHEDQADLLLASPPSPPSRAEERVGELEEALRSVKNYAEGHHAKEHTSRWLHSLAIDIPEIINRALSSSPSPAAQPAPEAGASGAGWTDASVRSLAERIESYYAAIDQEERQGVHSARPVRVAAVERMIRLLTPPGRGEESNNG